MENMSNWKIAIIFVLGLLALAMLNLWSHAEARPLQLPQPASGEFYTSNQEIKWLF